MFHDVTNSEILSTFKFSSGTGREKFSIIPGAGKKKNSKKKEEYVVPGNKGTTRV